MSDIQKDISLQLAYHDKKQSEQKLKILVANILNALGVGKEKILPYQHDMEYLEGLIIGEIIVLKGELRAYRKREKKLMKEIEQHKQLCFGFGAAQTLDAWRKDRSEENA